jgi:phenylalanyl-tRNA synthetase beta chain
VRAEVSIAEPTVISLQLSKANQYLGTSLTAEEIMAIFARLQLSANWNQGNETFVVQVPARRGDLVLDVDLIEEIARIYGYDQIPTSLIYGATTVGALSHAQHVRRTIRKLLTAYGLDEVINYSFSDPQKMDHVQGLYGHKKSVSLALPMSEERSVLRQSLVPHLLEVAAYNRNHNQPDVAVFELGHVFISEQTQLTELPQEPLHAAFMLTGNGQSAQWLQAARTVDFYDLKGMVDRLLLSLGIANVEYRATEVDGYHPGRTAEIYGSHGDQRIRLGVIGQVHPRVQQTYDIADTYVAELNVDQLVDLVNVNISYQSLARYPESKRDLALVVKREVASAQMVDTIRQFGGELLKSIQVFDVYTGEKIAADLKSIAFSLLFRHDERTLQDEEVQQAIDRILQALASEHAAELRK